MHPEEKTPFLRTTSDVRRYILQCPDEGVTVSLAKSGHFLENKVWRECRQWGLLDCSPELAVPSLTRLGLLEAAPGQCREKMSHQGNYGLGSWLQNEGVSDVAKRDLQAAIGNEAGYTILTRTLIWNPVLLLQIREYEPSLPDVSFIFWRWVGAQRGAAESPHTRNLPLHYMIGQIEASTPEKNYSFSLPNPPFFIYSVLPNLQEWDPCQGSAGQGRNAKFYLNISHWKLGVFD